MSKHAPNEVCDCPNPRRLLPYHCAASRERIFPDQLEIVVHRLPRGCLVIRDESEDLGNPEMVHICEVDKFMLFLTEFLADNPPTL